MKAQETLYTPRSILECWEKPFAWSIDHLRCKDADNMILPFILALLAALVISLTGVGLVLLFREYVIQKQEEAFKAGHVLSENKWLDKIHKLKEQLEFEKKMRRLAERSSHPDFERYQSQARKRRCLNRIGEVNP